MREALPCPLSVARIQVRLALPQHALPVLDQIGSLRPIGEGFLELPPSGLDVIGRKPRRRRMTGEHVGCRVSVATLLGVHEQCFGAALDIRQVTQGDHRVEAVDAGIGLPGTDGGEADLSPIEQLDAGPPPPPEVLSNAAREIMVSEPLFVPSLLGAAASEREQGAFLGGSRGPRPR